VFTLTLNIVDGKLILFSYGVEHKKHTEQLAISGDLQVLHYTPKTKYTSPVFGVCSFDYALIWYVT